MTALSAGYRLDDYTIEAVLGFGGFGITYKAVDSKDRLKTTLAIKEYFPRQLAVRGEDRVTVALHQEKESPVYKNGLQQFIEEAQTLRKFRHPAIVHVLRLLERNQTAYMVMEYIPGQTLQQWFQDNPSPNERVIKSLFKPILEGLGYVHQHNYLHRDLKPQNIYLRDKGGPMLLDFGAARLAMGELTALYTPGFAPFEQYHSATPGPWLDIYAVGATLYYGINHMVAPNESVARVASIQSGQGDPMVPAATIGKGRYSENFLNSIDWMLQTNIENRPHTVRDILQLWGLQLRGQPLNDPPAEGFSPTLLPEAANKAVAGKGNRRLLWMGLLTAVLVLAAGAAYQFRSVQPANSVAGSAADLSPEVPPPPKPEESAPIAPPVTATEPESSSLPQPGNPQGPSAPAEPRLATVDLPPSEQHSGGVSVEPAPPAQEDRSPPPMAPKKVMARLHINSQPGHAEVFIGDKAVGHTPLIVERSVPQELPVKISKFGFQPQYFQRTIDKGGDFRIQALLQPTEHPLPMPPYSPKISKSPLQEAANRGDSDAQYQLAARYETGQGVGKNMALAVSWYRRAVSANNVDAMTRLGYLYETGKGVSKDLQRAAELYRRAAMREHSGAQNNLAYMFRYGKGVQQSYKQALRWYRRAASHGDTKAQNSLGLMIAKGEGTRKNPGRAVKWWTLAAQKGHAEAQNNLGTMYQFGRGIAQNYREAVRWYRAAARQGVAAAQYNLGLMYEQGDGVGRNLSEAMHWYRMAARQGERRALNRLDR